MPVEQEKSPSESNRHGILHFGTHGSKWGETVVRTLISFLLGAISAAFFVGGKSRDVSDLLTWKGEVNAGFKATSERFDRLDREGTNRSHWTDDAQDKQIAVINTKISDLERKSESRGESISVMQGKIQRLEDELNNRRP